MSEKQPIKYIKNKPQIVSVEVLPGRVVKLSWTDAIGAEKYTIRRVTGEGDDKVNIKLDSVSAEFTSYCDTTITDDGEYRYYVVAIKKIAPKEYAKEKSKTKAATIISVGAPEKPTVKKTGNALTVQWEKDENAVGYVVLRRFSFMKKCVPLATLDADKTEYTDDSFCPGQLMYYAIQVISQNGENVIYSNPSDEEAGIVLSVPHVMKAKKKLFGKVEVKVRLCAGADGYILYRSSKERGTYKIACRTKSISDMTLNDTLKNQQKGAWYCVACYKNGTKKSAYVGPPTKPFYVK